VIPGLLLDYGQTGSYSESEGSLEHSGLLSPRFVALPVKLVLGLAMAIGLVPCSTATRYLTAKSLSNNSSDILAPSSDKHTDLAFVAGSEM